VATSDTRERNWPDCTFEFESEGEKDHGGPHWHPFYDSPDEILAALPDVLSKSTPHRGFGDTYRGPHKVPESWCQGAYLSYKCRPEHRLGLIAALRVSEKNTALVSVSPYAELGVQVGVAVERVHVWPSGAEAQLGCLWGEAPVASYDLTFLSSRGWYESGRRLDFILNGIAYQASPCSDEDLVVGADSVLGSWLQSESEPDSMSEVRVGLEGSSIFVPADGCDRDDYWFRGPVRRVKAFSDWFGQSGWSVRVCVMQMESEDAELEIHITDRVWSGSEPPRVGDDIEGTLWLQGRLWYLA